MHFGTFYGSEDESRQPLVELVEVLFEESADQGGGVEKQGWSVERRGIDLREGGLGLLMLGKLVFFPVGQR